MLMPQRYQFRMELRHLRYFVAAAEEQNFRRAAERVHVVQPALSRQIAMLEQELGFALFERSKKRVRLTPAGASYLADARWILREISLAGDRAARVASGKVGVLRLGFHETAGRSRIVSDSFRDFRRACPEIELSLLQMTSPSQIEAIGRGDLDAGYVYLPPALPPGFASRHVGFHRAYVAMRADHRLAGERAVRVAQLHDEPFIGIARAVSPAYHDALMRACRQCGLTPAIVQETQSEATTMNLVAVGLGLALVVSADEQSWTRDVVVRPVEGLDLSLDLALVWKEDRPAMAVRLLESLEALSPASARL